MREMPITLRRDALLAGQVRYYTGVPCKHGHLAERFSTSGGCVQCVNPKLYKARLDTTDPVHRFVRNIPFSLDRRMNAAHHLADLDVYLKACIDTFEASRKFLPWCPVCNGKAQIVDKGTRSLCTFCDATGIMKPIGNSVAP